MTKASFKRASPHEGDRRDFDGAALQHPIGTLDFHHVVKRVVQRAQIRVHFLLQIAGQEPELLAGFHRGPRKNDSADPLGKKKRDRLRHREVGFAGARRTDTKDDVALFDGFEVAPLIDALGHHLPLARGARSPAQKIIRQLDAFVLFDELGRRPDVPLRQAIAAANQPRQLPEQVFCPRDIGGLAFDDDFVRIRADSHVEQRLKMFEILVVGAVQRFGPVVRDRYLAHDCGRRDKGSPSKYAAFQCDRIMTALSLEP